MDPVAASDVELEQLHVPESATSGIIKHQHHVRFQEEKIQSVQVSTFDSPDTVTEKCICGSDKEWYYTVSIQGDRSKPAIVTLHDIGLDAELCFGGFFNYPDMAQLRQHFCVYHLTVMGQEASAPKLADNATFPSVLDLADMIGSFCGQYQIKYFVGLAVGVGANIMARFAYQQKEMINALCLVNCISTAAGWGEWGTQMVGGWMNSVWRRDQKLQQIEYLMWHYFGRNLDRCPDIVSYYRSYFAQRVETSNLSKFLDSYAHRTDIGLSREHVAEVHGRENPIEITAPTLLIAAQWSPHYDDMVAMNARMRPDKTEFMQISGADGAVLDECPDKVSQALVLHLQGCGFVSQFFRKRRFSDRGDY